MRCLSLVGLAVLTLAVPSARAQAYASDPQFFVGGALIVARPTGEFSNYVDVGGGLEGHALWLPARPGILGLRMDGSFLLYGSETRRYPLVPLVDVDVTTSNQIVGLLIGPELRAPRSAIRPHGYAQAGFSYFATTSSVKGSQSGNAPFANTTNFDDFTLAGSVGGGILIRLSDGYTPVSLDLGARYVLNGRARYLREGSVTLNGNAATFTPIESATNLMVYRLGVSIGIGGSRHRERVP